VDLRVPRRSVPRTRVPSGALAIANEFTIIYPESSPGGWNLIGHRVGPPLWVPGAQPPNAVDVGDRVRFVDVT
jgi:5-oxoprolinase (ATP-hydrolysing) subunit B